MPSTIVLSLTGTENLQTQNVTVIASASGGTTVQLGVPPSGAAPKVTIVSPIEGATLDLIGGALGITGGGSGTVVSGAAVATVATTGSISANYSGGYWLIS